jgi:hypothetical protein
MTAPTIFKRFFLLFILAGAGLIIGLANQQWVDLQIVDPQRAGDSVRVPTRGFPHGWLVVDAQSLHPPPTSRRFAWRNFLKSCFFWLAVASVTLCAASAARGRHGFNPLWRGTSGFRAFVSLATGSAAAGYAYLIAPGLNAPLLTLGTCLALLGPILLIRSPSDFQRHWRHAVASFVASLLIVAWAVAWAAGSFSVFMLLFLLLYLLASLAVALACLYSLTSTLREASPNPSFNRTRYARLSVPRVLWCLRLALFVAVVVWVVGLVILGHQPGKGELVEYGVLFGLYWLPIVLPWDAVIQILMAIVSAREKGWAALRSLLPGLLVDVCIAVVFGVYLLLRR